MWGAALFFITILMVTPCGRAAVDEYARQALSLFAAQLPYSDVALVIMGLSAVASFLLLCGRGREKPGPCWTLWEIRGELADEPARNRCLRQTG